MKAKTGTALGRLVAGTTAVALASLALMFVVWARSGWAVSYKALAVAAALALAGEFVTVQLSIGARRTTQSWSDTSLLIGLTLVPMPALVIVTAVAALAQQLWTRRRLAPTCFNASVAALYTLVSAGAIHGLCHLIGVRVGSPASWPILVLGGFIGSALSACLVAGPVSIVSGSSYLTVLRENVGVASGNYACNLVVAFSFLACWQYSKPTTLALPVFFLALWKVHSSRLNQTTEADVLGRLAKASAAMPATSLDELEAEVRERASSLFGARDAGLHLGREGRTAATGSLAEPPSETLEVPLIGRGGHLGYLALDIDQAQTLTQREKDVLTTFGNTTAAALETVLAHEAQLHAAQHDTLTGLPNRALLAAEAERILKAAAASGGRAAVIMIDLDGFKNVNDTLGHAAGDRLLVEIGARLGTSVRPRDCVARLGGDEFVVLLDGLETDVDAGRLAATLVERVSVPVTIDGLRIAVEASAGVALYPDHGNTIEGLLRCADIAMYDAKRRGDGVLHYDSTQDLASPERLSLLADLQVALDAEDQLSLHFQPQLDLRTGLTGNVEALIRWTHPTRGPLSPAEFVPVIEHSALIGAFTLKVLDTAVKACVAWQSDAALHGVGVAVNLSARNLMHRDLPDEVARILARHGLPARKLVLEITETAAMNDTEVCESVLGRLRDLGIRLSVDDFGTGYASLTFLRRIDVAEVKLDRAFVADMLEDDAAATIVGATVALAHGLGLTVVAEGVETPEQLSALKLAGCDLAQGYYLSRPVPDSALAENAEAAVAKAAQIGVVDHLPRVHPPRQPSYRDAGLSIAGLDADLST